MSKNLEKPCQLIMGGVSPESQLTSRDQTTPLCFAHLCDAISEASKKVIWLSKVGYKPWNCSLTDLRTGKVCRSPWLKKQVLTDLNVPFELAIDWVNPDGEPGTDPPRYFASRDETVEAIYNRALELTEAKLTITNCSIKHWQAD